MILHTHVWESRPSPRDRYTKSPLIERGLLLLWGESRLNSPRQDSALIPVFALVCAMLIWGSSFIVIKVALRTFHPVAMTFLRMLTASAILFLMLPRVRAGIRYRKGDWKLIVGLALCEPCLFFLFEGYALRYTSASQAGMIASVLPLLAALAAAVILKERLSGTNRLGFVLALAGVLWLNYGAVADESAPNPVLGNMLECAAMVCACGYTLCARSLTGRCSPLAITAAQSWTGLLFFAPLCLLPGMGLPEHASVEAILAVLYLGVVVTFGGYGCYNYGISRLGAGRAAAFCNLIPVVTLIMGVWILGESLTTTQYTACVLVLGGVYAGLRTEP